MLQITGQVVNVFTLDAGKDKDGKDYAERYKVQLMGNVALPNGDAKFDLMDLTVEFRRLDKPTKQANCY